jgi:ubiquinone/menaquinone biosynthesis C-methylase UbiE
MAAAGTILLAQAGVYLHTTLRGKLRIWERELDRAGLRGDEQLLDLGCGRGAVLIAAARRLPAGRAVGADLWTTDQSGNRPEATLANAVAAGVADRVEVHTADMTALPFPDGSFDVVTSAMAIHNIPSPEGRCRAVDEAMRVLRPGGQLLIADISFHARRYAAHIGQGTCGDWGSTTGTAARGSASRCFTPSSIASRPATSSQPTRTWRRTGSGPEVSTRS